ncbi:MAG: M48 family metallopeptidase [bacterium]
MWELISANKRKSVILFSIMGACLVLLGYFGGEAFAPGGGVYGLLLALVFWLIQSVIAFFMGDSVLLSSSQAQEINEWNHPKLFNIVEEMKIASGLEAMPKIYLINAEAPNAFATGRNPQKSAVAVTTGLLSKCNRDELQGVIAHEISHIMNRDILFMTFAAVMLGSVFLLSRLFLREMHFPSRSRRYTSKSSGGGQAQLIIFIVAIILAVIAPILAQILYFAISRKREYLADASGARLTRYPEGLASALEKIAFSEAELPSENKVTAPLYIVNPLKKGLNLSALTSTHPPILERVAILRSMGGGSGYLAYQNAFKKVTGKSSLLPASAMKDFTDVSAREPSREEEKSRKEKVRDIGDLLRAINNFGFILCACGLKIKMPPGFKNEKLSCPRCGREHEVPFVAMAAATAVAGDSVLPEKNRQEYQRKGHGWESFQCQCGRIMQLSPSFQGTHVRCNTCGSNIKIGNRSPHHGDTETLRKIGINPRSQASKH